MVIRRSDWILIGLIGVILFTTGVYAAIDNVKIKRDLEQIAERKAREYMGPYADKYEYVVIVKRLDGIPLFSIPRGGIHLFLREKGDAEMKTFKGIEYYCKRVGGQWTVIDSAGCSALEHHCQGFKEMEAKGFEVSPKVYEKLNRD